MRTMNAMSVSEVKARLTQNGNDAFAEANAEYMQDLINMKPANSQPLLKKSPYVKIKATGEIMPWSDSFSLHPELCENCDEHGNPCEGIDPPHEEQPVVMNTKLVNKNVGDEHTSPVGMASEVLGVAPEYSRDFTERTTVKESFTLPPQQQSVDVNKLIDAMFKDNVVKE